MPKSINFRTNIICIFPIFEISRYFQYYSFTKNQYNRVFVYILQLQESIEELPYNLYLIIMFTIN